MTKKETIPSSRLFKVLNPELYMKPNRFIMYGGLVALGGVILWLGSRELQYRQQAKPVDKPTATEPRTTYQQQMADLKKHSQ